MNRRLTLILCAIAVALTAAAYLPSLRSGFVNLDDPVMVADNPAITRLTPGGIAGFFTSFHYGLYHPLVLVSYAAEYRCFGPGPFAFHVTNYLLHLANTLLVFALVLGLSRRPWAAFAAAVLFGVHPLHVESVAWISERKDVLYAFFFLGALLSWLAYLRRGSKRFYALTLVLFLCSLLSKSMAVTLPLVLFLMDALAGRRQSGRTILEKLPFLALAAVFAALAVPGYFDAGSGPGLSPGRIVSRFAPVSRNIVFYLGKLAAPANLSCVYPAPEAAGAAYRLAPGIVVLLASAAAGLWRFARLPAFGLSFFLVTLLPVAGFIPFGVSPVADRYMYLPALGLFFAAGAGFSRLLERAPGSRTRLALMGLLAVIAAGLAAGAWRRCGVWQDSLTLWNDTIAKHPGIGIAWFNRGLALRERGDVDGALADLNRALEFDPRNHEILNSRGLVFRDRGESGSARADYLRALELKPGYARAHVNLGNLSLLEGDAAGALRRYGRALELDPGLSLAWFNRGKCRAMRGEHAAALADFTRALELHPGYRDAYLERGISWLSLNEYSRALADFDLVIRRWPRFAPAYHNRGTVSGNMGEYRKAVDDYTTALVLDPSFADTWANRALAFLFSGLKDQARDDARKARALGARLHPSLLPLIEE